MFLFFSIIQEEPTASYPEDFGNTEDVEDGEDGDAQTTWGVMEYVVVAVTVLVFIIVLIIVALMVKFSSNILECFNNCCKKEIPNPPQQAAPNLVNLSSSQPILPKARNLISRMFLTF